jgi:hypothetical protein
MNTGMLDATNLGWKLAAVLTRQAPDGLLDSYGLERGPVAQQVLSFTQTMVTFATAGRSLRRTVRNAGLPAFRLPTMQRRLAGRISQVAVAYPSSPLSRPGRIPGLPNPGDRMPNIAVIAAEGPSTLYAALRGGRHVLVICQNAADDMDLDRYREFAEIVRAPLGHRRAVALVRPDGYLAALATTGNTVSIDEYVTEHVGSWKTAPHPRSTPRSRSTSSAAQRVGA